MERDPAVTRSQTTAEDVPEDAVATNGALAVEYTEDARRLLDHSKVMLKTLDSPAGKWALRALAAALTWIATAILWPSASSWVNSRADHDQVTALQRRVEVLEKAREINYARLYTSDSLKLTDSEQIQWLIVKMDSIQTDLNREIGERLYLEVLLLNANPRSPQARKLASLAKSEFEALLDKGLDANSAAIKALNSARE